MSCSWQHLLQMLQLSRLSIGSGTVSWRFCSWTKFERSVPARPLPANTSKPVQFGHNSSLLVMKVQINLQVSSSFFGFGRCLPQCKPIMSFWNAKFIVSQWINTWFVCLLSSGNRPFDKLFAHELQMRSIAGNKASIQTAQLSDNFQHIHCTL